jgi:ABC-type cobalt transport system substrate-binding protein
VPVLTFGYLISQSDDHQPRFDCGDEPWFDKTWRPGEIELESNLPGNLQAAKS